MSTTVTLPPAPDSEGLRQQLMTRLRAIESEALPVISARRRLLERLWCTNGGDGEVLYATPDQAIHVHPAGADRLAGVLAEQHSFIVEAEAQRELAVALDAYDAGGSLVALMLDAQRTDPSQPSTGTAPHPSSDENEMVDETAYTRWLLRYLMDVRREIWIARKDRDPERRRQLEAEFSELQTRIQQRSAAMRAATAALAAAVMSESA